MKEITVNLCVREPEDYLNYHLSSFKVNENFPNQIIKGVINLTQKQKRKYGKIVKSFLGATISFLSLTSKSMANALTDTQSQTAITSGIPTDLLEPIMELIKLALGGSLLLSVILLIAAGTLRQFRKKKEASEWTTDIIKGFLQVLIATPLIFLLYYAVTLLLGNFTQFLKPF